MNIQSKLLLTTLTIFISIILIGCGNNSESNNDDSRSKQGWNNQGNWVGKNGVFDLTPENRVRVTIQQATDPPGTLGIRYKTMDVVLSEETKHRLENTTNTTIGHEQYVAMVLTPSESDNHILIAQEHIVDADTAKILEPNQGNHLTSPMIGFGPALTEAIEIHIEEKEDVYYPQRDARRQEQGPVF